ncbi:MAG: hypothetical protein AAF493_13740 [Pseudomonadota bacterium]
MHPAGTKTHEKTVQRNGETVIIIASQMEPGMWELAIANDRGGRQVWTDYFPSPEAVFSAGTEAIEEEGIETFTAKSDFEEFFEEFQKKFPKDWKRLR